MNQTSSVHDTILKKALLREAKKEDNYKDFLSFFLLSIFLPKTALLLSTLNFARNLAISTDINDSSTVDILEKAQIGKYTRLFLLIMPLKFYF